MGTLIKYEDKNKMTYYKMRVFYTTNTGEKKRIMLPDRFYKKSDAYRAEEQFLKKYDKTDRDYKDYLMNDFAVKWLLEHSKNIRKTTIESYANMVTTYIIPYFGNMRLNAITQVDIINWHSYLSGIKHQNKDKNLSTKTIRNIHNCLNLIFTTAYKWDIIDENVMTRVDPPKFTKKEVTIIRDDDLKNILINLKDHESYLIYFLLAHTGCRAGEIVALKNRDYGSVVIEKNGARQKTKALFIQRAAKSDDTKTESSKRTIVLSPILSEKLDEYIKNKYRNIISLYNRDDEYIFTWANDGRPFTVDFISKKFKKIVRELNLNDVYHVHALRHTHATTLLKKGVHPKIVSERLGHSSIQITLDTYSHVTPTLQAEIITDELLEVSQYI